MSPLAEVLLARGYCISGSDAKQSPRTDALAAHGARVRIGHDPSAVDGAALVVYSTAIRDDNPELRAARERGLVVMHRSELLAELLLGQRPIAVAGTHGKTTTTGMIGLALARAGLDPTVIVGGEVRDWGGHHRVGRSDLFVLEACESDNSFLNYQGCNQVITSLEPDHLDQHGTFEKLCENFERFVELGRPDGFLVYCSDSPLLRGLAEHAPGKTVSYGVAEHADLLVGSITTDTRSVSFDMQLPEGATRRIVLSVPGAHNALNAAAAFAAATQAGATADAAIEGIAAFSGIGRRFDVLSQSDDMMVVDDYAHHPTEIEATLRTARAGWRGRIIAVFQPHLFSRTKHLMDGFARAFTDADEVIITDIYAAREDPLPGVDARQLAEAVARNEPSKPVRFLPTKPGIVDYLAEHVAPGALVLTIGAGDIHEVGERLAGLLKEREATAATGTTARRIRS